MAEEGGEGDQQQQQQQQQGGINLATLSLEQLNQLRGQYQEEVQALTANYASLRDARARFQESKAAVSALGGEASNGKEVLVPLTQSLYVPGRVVDGNKMLVDVGTGYYAELTSSQTEDFLQRKSNMLETNLNSLRDIIDAKRKDFEVIAQVMQQRLAQVEQRRAELMASSEN